VTTDIRFSKLFSTISLQRKLFLYIVVALSLIFIGSGIFIYKLVNDTFIESEKRHIAIISESLSAKVGVWYFINNKDDRFLMDDFLNKILTTYKLEYIAFKNNKGILVSQIKAPSFLPNDPYNITYTAPVYSPDNGVSNTLLGSIEIAYGHHLLKKLSLKYYAIGVLLIFLLALYFYLEMRLLKELLTPLRRIAKEIKGYLPGDKLSFNSFNTHIDDEISEIINGFLHMQQNIDDAMKKRAIEEEKTKIKDAFLLKQARFIEMGTMINNIAHQWKQPLNVIELCIADLSIKSMMGPIDPAYQQKLFDDMHLQISYMSKTIDIFKNFLNDGQSTKKMEVFSIKRAIEETMHLLGSTLSSKKISTAFTLDEKSSVYGSINEMEQVILIIINNAIEAKSTRITVMCIAGKEENIIKISDNGGGFSPNIIDHMFDAYFTTKHQSQGTGLGLFIAKMIIEMKFKWTIEAQNYNDGALFIIKLPYPDKASE